jgi:hypothetical protein
MRNELRRIVCRPDDRSEEEMTSDGPREKEYPKCTVTQRPEGGIAEHLGKLEEVGKKERRSRYSENYRKPDIAPVHEDHDHATDAGKVIEVAADHKGDRNHMMNHHLPVVLSASLGIKEQDTMHVEGILGKIVEFDGSGNRSVGVSDPKGVGGEYTRGKIFINVLQAMLDVNSHMRR